MLFTCEMAMNFVMKDKCIDVDSALLRLSVKSRDKACLLTPTIGCKRLIFNISPNLA